MNREQLHKEIECNDNYLGWHNAHELADKLYNNFATVYVVEQWENIPYGEYMGIQGVYMSKEDAVKATADKGDVIPEYDFSVNKMEVKT